MESKSYELFEFGDGLSQNSKKKLRIVRYEQTTKLNDEIEIRNLESKITIS